MFHAAAIAPGRMRLDVAPDLIRLPLFDEDLEVGGLPAEVVAMQARIRAADGVLLATPEYNFGVPGPVKNFVDWASRPPGRGAFVGKPVALIGASTGRVGGTVQAQGQLRISLAVIGAHVMPSPPILVAEAHTRFEEELLVDEPTDKILGIALGRFLDLIDALAPRVPADA
jgi:chromate reductase